MRGRWGDKGVMDLAGLIGYYSFVSVTLNIFEVPTAGGGASAGADRWPCCFLFVLPTRIVVAT
jgi:hypothetical protein